MNETIGSAYRHDLIKIGYPQYVFVDDDRKDLLDALGVTYVEDNILSKML